MFINEKLAVRGRDVLDTASVRDMGAEKLFRGMCVMINEETRISVRNNELIVE